MRNFKENYATRLGRVAFVVEGLERYLMDASVTHDENNVMRSAGCQKSLTDTKPCPNGAGHARGQRTG
jgi:hypothetical protein